MRSKKLKKKQKHNLLNATNIVKEQTEYTNNSIKINNIVKIPNPRYIDSVIRLNCFDVYYNVIKKCRYPARDISKSYGCFQATFDFVKYKYSNCKSITCYVLGDGKVPKTGSLNALMTKWNIISIDPIAISKKESNANNINRLSIHSIKAEDYDYKEISDLYIIISPHGHAPLDIVFNKFKQQHDIYNLVIVTLDCCFGNNLDKEKNVTLYKKYDDFKIFSPKREIKIFETKNIT
jgi:hypothetical protein